VSKKIILTFSPHYLRESRRHINKNDIDNFVDEELSARLSIFDGETDVSIKFVDR
jgi:hypothetical protein